MTNEIEIESESESESESVWGGGVGGRAGFTERNAGIVLQAVKIARLDELPRGLLR